MKKRIKKGLCPKCNKELFRRWVRTTKCGNCGFQITREEFKKYFKPIWQN